MIRKILKTIFIGIPFFAFSTFLIPLATGRRYRSTLVDNVPYKIKTQTLDKEGNWTYKETVVIFKHKKEIRTETLFKSGKVSVQKCLLCECQFAEYPEPKADAVMICDQCNDPDDIWDNGGYTRQFNDKMLSRGKVERSTLEPI